MASLDLTAAQNLRLFEELEANRAFVLLAYRSNPSMLAWADPEIKRLFEPLVDSARPSAAVPAAA